MKYKILEVKKRSWFVRFLTDYTKAWKVTVELEDGTIKKLDCWAGCPEFGTITTKHRLIYSINKCLEPLEEPENLKELEGTEEEIE